MFLLFLFALDYLSLSSATTVAREGGNEYIQATPEFIAPSNTPHPTHRSSHFMGVAWFHSDSETSDASECDLREEPFQRGTASWYGPGFNGRPMANGDRFDMEAATVAHKKLPLGTRVCIKNPANERVVIATVTDRGPYVGERIVDLSKGVARALDIKGLSRVEIFVI
jgi:rare lipoprotein A (peptidoglycan hydrolase)